MVVHREVPHVHVRPRRKIRDVIEDIFAMSFAGADINRGIIDCFFALAAEEFDLGGLAVVVHAGGPAEMVLVHALRLHGDEGIRQGQDLQVDRGRRRLVVVQDSFGQETQVLPSK